LITTGITALPYPKISYAIYSYLNLIFKDYFRLLKVVIMGKVIVTLTNKTEKKLRELVKTKYSNKRGALSIVVEEALKKYLGESL